MNLFETTIKPRFYETDGLGHISNTVIPAWFEIGRTEFLSSLAGEKRTWLTASVQIDYVAETFYGTDVTVRITGAKPGNSSLTLYCEILQEGRVTVRGSSVLVHMSDDRSGSARIPDAVREALASAGNST
ncbi:acyl-CoA thioesterase [Haliea sp. E17]|uniref:acyl-CoA thioesterase n=1 Tax=Haliea sp. E17 TaxID=3401576 RepID=UPI003AB0C9A7